MSLSVDPDSVRHPVHSCNCLSGAMVSHSVAVEPCTVAWHATINVFTVMHSCADQKFTLPLLPRLGQHHDVGMAQKSSFQRQSAWLGSLRPHGGGV